MVYLHFLVCFKIKTMNTNTEKKTNSNNDLMPMYKVLLHNDDVNSCDYVVVCLLKTVNTLSTEQAINIMTEADNTGIALITVVPLEIAEHYSTNLQNMGLTSTIEPEVG